MVARCWGCQRVPPPCQHREQDAGDHKGLVKIPRIFLASPLPTTLAPTDGDELSVKLMPIGPPSGRPL